MKRALGAPGPAGVTDLDEELEVHIVRLGRRALGLLVAAADDEVDTLRRTGCGSLSLYIYPSVNISHPPRRRLRLALLSRPDTQVIQSLPCRHTMLSAVHGRHFAFFLENRLSTLLLLKAKTQPALQLGCSVSTQPQTSIQTTTWSKSKLDTYPGRARLTRRSEQSFIRTRHRTGWM
jgi:hypothetical protein